jgi:hypothetical protein
MKCFYIVPSEIFPTNISNKTVSSITNKHIKGRIIKYNCDNKSNLTLINFHNSISVSQGLEIFKYQNFGLKSEGFGIYNPFI